MNVQFHHHHLWNTVLVVETVNAMKKILRCHQEQEQEEYVSCTLSVILTVSDETHRQNLQREREKKDHNKQQNK